MALYLIIKIKHNIKKKSCTTAHLTIFLLLFFRSCYFFEYEYFCLNVFPYSLEHTPKYTAYIFDVWDITIK